MEEWIKQLWTWLLALILAAFQPLSVAILELMENMEITINGNKNNVSKESFISLIASELVSI